MYNDITGIILSGGKSSRMGENKSLLKIKGLTVIEHVIKLMQSLFSGVILITNTPDAYKFLNLTMYEDIYPYRGPLAGIHSGLFHADTEKNFIISCDLPLMTKEMIEYLIKYETNKPISIYRIDGFYQQLMGLYSKSVLAAADKILNDNEEMKTKNKRKSRYKVHSLINKVGAEIIDAENLDFYKEGIFFNMNRPDDYNEIIKLI